MNNNIHSDEKTNTADNAPEKFISSGKFGFVLLIKGVGLFLLICGVGILCSRAGFLGSINDGSNWLPLLVMGLSFAIIGIYTVFLYHPKDLYYEIAE